jgi:hypothetical protein
MADLAKCLIQRNAGSGERLVDAENIASHFSYLQLDIPQQSFDLAHY